MTLRKFSAAVLASVVASGAMAQAVTNTDSLNVGLTVDPVSEVEFEGASAAFSSGAVNATASDALCVYSNLPDYEVTVTSGGAFEIVNADDATATAAYTLTIGGTSVAEGDALSKSDLASATLACSDSPSYDHAVVATLTEAATTAGTYSDTITVLIAAP